ncbi:hypothetical protein PBI_MALAGASYROSE_59 [Mycobacterium phage MalagasyRose]|uniref:MazG-like nucleotide pyrophosphohydrolase n=1 Tax=Mycobacterium phage MalagasyRose TaxID=2599870 RepID=A0A5J6TGD9_9CAUD|nr:hypothetical protein QEH39_gp29 [Mycobacterium phage MalagasyRose]QFG08907.1 hypothetical protein PBI_MALAGASYROSE_59 [Mycobacterium phage MalagasyRose]
MDVHKLARALALVADERHKQDEKWGEQSHPDADPNANYPIGAAGHCKTVTNMRAESGVVTWADILIEEVAEAIDEARAGNRQALRDELVQVAAVAVQWIEKLDTGER